MPAAEEFGVRVTGLPAGVLTGLRAERAWAAAQQVLDIEARLSAEGAGLSGELHRVIGAAADPAYKPRLVALRRAVFAGRRPRSREFSADLRAVLPARTDERIAAWLRLLDRRDELRDRLPQLLGEETRQARGRLLAAAAAAPAFRAGLAQAVPDLAAELDTWLRAGPAAAPDRKALLRVARYLARAAAKTSPFATFTGSGLGRWRAGGPPVDGRPLRRAGVVELHRAAVDTIWRHLADRAGLRDRVGIRANPSAVDDGDRIVFLRPGPAEPITSIAAVPAIRSALAAVRSRPAATRAELSGPVIDPQLLDALLEHGLLERCRPYADQAADPLGDLIAWLPDDAGEIGELDRLRALVREPAPPGDPGSAGLRRERIRAAVQRLTPEGTQLPGKALALESALHPGTVARCDPRAWAPALADLQAVRVLLGVLDPDLPVKRAAAAAFSSLFGPGARAPLLGFYHRVHRGGGNNNGNGSSDGPADLRMLLRAPLDGFATEVPVALAEVRKLRSDLWRTIYQTPESAPGVIRLDPATAYKTAATWPADIRAPRSVCCYVQPLAAERPPRLVLNTVSSGHGRGTGRLRRLLAEAGGRLPPACAPPDPGVAECRGAFGHTLSLRSARARPISYPGVADSGPGTEPAGDAVALADLAVRHDPQRGVLTLHDPAGRELRPAHLGMLAPYLLPPAFTFLLRVFGESAQPLPPSWRLRGGGEQAAPGIERWPRVDIGAVTLLRGCHRMPAEQIPLPAKGEREADHLVRFARWLRDHGLPAAFFARVVPRDPLQRALGKSTKPLYVDAAAPHLLRDFFRAVREPGGTVLLEEVLPAPGDNPRYGADGVRVTEFAVQIDAGTDTDTDTGAGTAADGGEYAEEGR
ncbi:hypothetical protein GCM10027570_08820 [Streptomonospora sediminis]